MNKTVLLAGGTGLIGQRLEQILVEKGYTVRILTRNPGAPNAYFWDPMQGKIDDEAVRGVDYVVNLAGAGIADKRWTPARKKEIIDSRLDAAHLLGNAIIATSNWSTTYISASAIGYYGNSGEMVMTENAAPADRSFMVECCLKWEAIVQPIIAMKIRTVILRIGVVLAAEGGALAEVIKPLKFGLGAYFGNGQAWWSWIHRDDLCQMIVWSIENQSVSGTFNAVAPAPVRGKALVQAAAKAMRRWAIFVPAPEFVLKLMLGEMSAVVLNSNHVSAQKIVDAGFEFQYPTLDKALSSILSHSQNG
jgi:hypothetical protein